MVQTHQNTEQALAEMDERIDRFAALEPDWDSYGAKTVSPTAIATVKNVLRAVTAQADPAIGDRVLAVWLGPLPNGGIVLEWRGPTADLDVEVTASGALDLLLEERGRERVVTTERADVTIAEIVSLLDRVLAP
jgi:hypothetical protein